MGLTGLKRKTRKSFEDRRGGLCDSVFLGEPLHFVYSLRCLQWDKIKDTLGVLDFQHLPPLRNNFLEGSSVPVKVEAARRRVPARDQGFSRGFDMETVI